MHGKRLCPRQLNGKPNTIRLHQYRKINMAQYLLMCKIICSTVLIHSRASTRNMRNGTNSMRRKSRPPMNGTMAMKAKTMDSWTHHSMMPNLMICSAT